jgi:hypothetical protein
MEILCGYTEDFKAEADIPVEVLKVSAFWLCEGCFFEESADQNAAVMFDVLLS